MTAEQLLIAALSAYARGEYLRTADYCQRALDMPGVSDTLTVRLIYLALTATELWWTIDPSKEVRAQVKAAVEAAERTGDPALRALAAVCLGTYLIAAGGLPEAISAFESAASHATESENSSIELQALACLGHHLIGRDMARGIAVLNQARAVAERCAHEDPHPWDRPLVRVQLARLHGYIGVAAFDDGRFGEAETYLRRSLTDLMAAKSRDQFAMISNYLGQLLTTTGRFEEAEAVLRTALRLLEVDADLSVHQGYNQGLLGKLYLEWGRLESADQMISAGWERVTRAGHVSIIPLLRTYLAELLMIPAYHRFDLNLARQLCDDTVEECLRTGFQRSEIAALALRALVDLRRGDLEGALEASLRAVARLEETGTMPALRTEEVYFARYLVLRTADSEEAQAWLARAKAVLMAKAETLPSPELRMSLLTRVPLSSAILHPPSGTPQVGVRAQEA
ncbi:tetratricopeptide repeat protein [Nonomuraea sp. NPDC046802]|uniref:tetratricopeptide repeat protein n=1 Tax=Nonomuraea sp. NPDC046802 TaxID=3154919 RepID=UPI0033E26825